MLLSFSVENCLSYRNRVSFDFTPERSSRFPTHVASRKGTRAPKATKFNVFFGPNGAGKSNFIFALAFCREVVLRGIPSWPLADFPFCLTDSDPDSIGSFSFRICPPGSNDILTYSLQINYFDKSIVSECFQYGERTAYSVKSSRDSYPEIGHVRFFQKNSDRTQLLRYLQDYCSKKAPRQTLLNYLFDGKKYDEDSEIPSFFSPVFDFFRNLTILSPSPHNKTFITLLENAEIQDQIRREIQKFNIGVSELKLQEISEKEFLGKANIDEKDAADFLRDVKEYTEKGHVASFSFGGDLFFAESRSGAIHFLEVVLFYKGLSKKHDLSMESDGTRKLINMIPLLLKKENATIVIDEVDRSFHTKMTRQFVNELMKTFSKPAPEVQLLMTAHDIQLFSLSIFRPDEIFLLDRNYDTYATSANKLSSLKIRYDREIIKHYLSGMYGSIPNFSKK